MLADSIPKEPNFSITAGIRMIKAYIPFPIGPKTLAKIIDETNPRVKISICDEKVINTPFLRLIIGFDFRVTWAEQSR